MLPAQQGYIIDYYRHNGYLYNLEVNRRYVILATTATPQRCTKKVKFMMRTLGPKLSLSHLL